MADVRRGDKHPPRKCVTIYALSYKGKCFGFSENSDVTMTVTSRSAYSQFTKVEVSIFSPILFSRHRRPDKTHHRYQYRLFLTVRRNDELNALGSKSREISVINISIATTLQTYRDWRGRATYQGQIYKVKKSASVQPQPATSHNLHVAIIGEFCKRSSNNWWNDQ